MRTLKNKAEREFQIAAESKGWTISKRGWPDFFCTRGDEVICVEVKPKATHKLKREQATILKFLAKHDIKAFKWTPDGRLESIE
jgi:Holliday junction resolvase